MQDINIFEEVAIKVSMGKKQRETCPVCSLSHFVGLYSYRQLYPFCPVENLNARSQNKEKSLCYLTFPHTPLSSFKNIIILSASSMQLHMDPSCPKEISYKGPQQIENIKGSTFPSQHLPQSQTNLSSSKWPQFLHFSRGQKLSFSLLLSARLKAARIILPRFPSR